MAKITGEQLRSIQDRIAWVEEHEDTHGSIASLISDAKRMAEIIQKIREDLHQTEDAEASCLWIAELLGTNCRPGSDIDDH